VLLDGVNTGSKVPCVEQCFSCSVNKKGGVNQAGVIVSKRIKQSALIALVNSHRSRFSFMAVICELISVGDLRKLILFQPNLT